MPRPRAKNRRVARLAAGLGGDARDLAVSEEHDVRGEQFVGHEHERPGHRGVFRQQHVGEMAADPHDHVADVGHPFAEILVLGAGEQGRIFLQHAVERVGGRLMAIDDPMADFFVEGRIAEDRLVGLKDRGLGFADLRGDLLVKRAEIVGRRIAGLLVAGQLGKHLVGGKSTGLRIHEYLVNAIGRSHGHPGETPIPFPITEHIISRRRRTPTGLKRERGNLFCCAAEWLEIAW